ncbi:hypothetical protein NYO67_11222 [Aspergillus flavus]|nr:hypothetical protein NYO67_11222 [Aspergillus flavus]
MASCLPPETQERHSVFRLPFLSSNFIELFSSSLRLPANLKHLLLNPPSSTQNGELVVTFTSSFNAIWNDAGSGTTRDGCFWHPITQGTLRPLGSMAVGNFKELNGQRAALLIGAKSTSSSNPPVKAPTSYTHLWADKGSGAKLNGSFWRPIAPSGYIAMGDVVQSGYTTPSTSKVWCLRSDLVADGQYADESV